MSLPDNKPIEEKKGEEQIEKENTKNETLEVEKAQPTEEVKEILGEATSSLENETTKENTSDKSKLGDDDLTTSEQKEDVATSEEKRQISKSEEEKSKQTKKTESVFLRNNRFPPKVQLLSHQKYERKPIDYQKLAFSLNEKQIQDLELKNRRFVPIPVFPLNKKDQMEDFLYTATEFLRKKNSEKPKDISFKLKYYAPNLWQKILSKFIRKKIKNFFTVGKINLENLNELIIENKGEVIEVSKVNPLPDNAKNNFDEIIKSKLSENIVFLTQISKQCGVIPTNDSPILIESTAVSKLHCTDFCVFTNRLLTKDNRKVIEQIGNQEFYLDNDLCNSFRIRDHETAVKLINHLLSILEQLGFTHEVLCAGHKYLFFKICPVVKSGYNGQVKDKIKQNDTFANEKKKFYKTYTLYYEIEELGYFYNLYHFGKQLIHQVLKNTNREEKNPSQSEKEKLDYFDYLLAILEQEKEKQLNLEGLKYTLTAWLCFEILYTYNKNQVLWKLFMEKIIQTMDKASKTLLEILDKIRYLRLDLNVPVPLVFMAISDFLRKLYKDLLVDLRKTKKASAISVVKEIQ